MLRKILSSIDLTDQEINDSYLFCLTRWERKCVANIIYQDKFKNRKDHQLNEKGYDILKHLLINSLSLFNFDNKEDDLVSIILMIKSTFHYFKTEEISTTNSSNTINTGKSSKSVHNHKMKKNKYLFKEFSKSYKGFFQNNIFWLMWFKLHLSEEPISINCDDDFYFAKLLELYTVMKSLNLDLDWICNIITYISQNYMKDSNNIESLISIITKQYKQDSEKI